MSYADVDLYEVEAYMKQMKSIAPGYVALWDPKPYNKKEAEIGDVGYIYKGTFRRLFNAVSSEFDPKNAGLVPDGFEPLPYNPETDVVSKSSSEVLLPGVPCSSHRVKVEPVDAQQPDHRVFKLTKTANDLQFVLVAPAAITEKVLKPELWDLWKAYFYENHKSWLQFGGSQLGRPMKIEEIILVRGWVKSSKWTIATLQERGEYILDLDMSLNLSASLQYVTHNTSSDRDVRFGADPPEVILEGFREQRSLMGLPPSEKLTDPRTRCLFVQGFRMESQFLSGKKIVAAAEPKDPDTAGGDDDASPIGVVRTSLSGSCYQTERQRVIPAVDQISHSSTGTLYRQTFGSYSTPTSRFSLQRLRLQSHSCSLTADAHLRPLPSVSIIYAQ